ncbi:MAG: DUF3108 domain-containing protein [Acidobacteria bacterium]|nr:DUF3108 domain-containing protein [Acidobacteriota bacterium]
MTTRRHWEVSRHFLRAARARLPSLAHVSSASLLYIAAAVLITWPLALQFTSHLGALSGPGDPYLNLWILGWGLHAWVTDPLSVLQGRVFDANIFYPAAGALTFSDHFLLQAFVLSPVYALTGDTVLCYNLLLVGSIAASGLAMHVAVRGVTGSTAASVVAGLAWAIWPYRTAHLGHIQLQALYFLPLAVAAVHRLAAGQHVRTALGLGVLAALQATASVYYGVMTAIVVAVAALALAVGTGQWRSRQLWSRLVLAGSVGALLIVPVVLPYLQSQRQQGFGRNLYEAANHAAGLASYGQVPSVNAFYGRLGVLEPRVRTPGERDRSGAEHEMFPGVVVLALGVVGLWRGWRSDARPATWVGAALAVTGLVLSFGPEGVRPLYVALYDHVFGFEAIRAPARFAVVTMTGLVWLAAVGVRSIERRRPTSARVPLAIVLAPMLLLEYANVPLPLVVAPARETPTGQWLRTAAEAGPVVHLPISIDIESTPSMVQSLEHWRPIVNGYSGQRPALYSAIVEGLSGFPTPEGYATLRQLNVRFVASAAPIADAGAPGSPLVERATLPDGVIYEVRWTAESEAITEEAAVPVPVPPPPGPAPFAIGERLSYEISWESGPIDLAAGEATLSVVAPDASGSALGGSWAFEARATSADWVARFFEARDRFLTAADSELRPLLHTREIREGRRHYDRSYVFDRAASVVRSGDTPAAAASLDAVSLPTPEGVRDALTTFYYVRTFSLVPGDTLTLPVNDGGRNMVLHLLVGDHETIEHGGRPARTLRLEPRLARRIDRRQPLALTVWLSDDERRVPLAVSVSAGFGRLRADLVDYQR